MHGPVLWVDRLPKLVHIQASRCIGCLKVYSLRRNQFKGQMAMEPIYGFVRSKTVRLGFSISRQPELFITTFRMGVLYHLPSKG